MTRLSHGYSAQIGGYDAWKIYIMTLVRFKQIISAFHPQSRASFYGDKFHKMDYFICVLNDKEKMIFVLEYHSASDEGGIAARIQ